MLRFLLILLVLGPTLLPAQSKPWPREFRIRPAKLVITTNDQNGNQVADTKHFRIETESKISRPDFQRFANVVESVPQLIQKFPLPLWSPPAKRKIDIFIAKNEANFLNAGGQSSTIGWYNGRRGQVLIRADYFLTPPSFRPTRLTPRPNEDILVHELAHMGMHRLLWHLPSWLSEGLAEYFSVCHKGNGYFTFHDVGTSTRDRIRNAVGRNENDQILLLPVADILGYDPKGWIEATQSFQNGNPYLPYATALLLAHYHLNGGQTRRDMTAAYLKKLQSLGFRDPTPPFPAEDAQEIQARLVKYWRPRGLNLVFARN